MPEPISYVIAEGILKKLGSPVFHEIELMACVKYELEKLEDTLSNVKAVLLDADEQQESSHTVADCVRKLNDVVYDADDLLDDFATEDLRRKTDDRGICGQVTDFFSSSNQLVFLCKMGHRVKAIRERLDDIANDFSQFNFMLRDKTSDAREKNRWRETCSVEDQSKIVGRDKNRKEIIELLKQTSTQGNLPFVVIVGMGGLGKTTLARLVYNDQWAVNYFDFKMWVYVYYDFDVRELFKNILMSATNEDVGDLPLEQLRIRLHRKLDGKKYLLVLDDVWNGDKGKWGQFITLLPVGANGSKILVTTRSEIVARVIGIDRPYVVKGLKDDESWDLFESVAFKKGEEQMHPNLVAIGKEIVEMCKGVPLVIKTLGTTLCFTRQQRQWLNIRDNKNLIMLGDKYDILPVLRLSYDNLPIHLKQCFAYCALFPKDYIIEKRLLVQLWMAQGYIQPLHENENENERENERLEYVGDEYFEDLWARSLFQEFQKDDANNVILNYKIHDLIHDLAQSIVKSQVIILMDDIPERIRHVSLFKQPNRMLEGLKGKPIRTLFTDSYCDDRGFISSLKCLRVLKIKLSDSALSSSLAKLSHLRYLDLSRGLFKKLPDDITSLQHLQTLKLFRCTKLEEWPINMKRLTTLRHLEFDSRNKLTYMPRGLGELTNLQTLPLFLVAYDSRESRHKRMARLSELKLLRECRRKRMARLSELKLLNNLKGELEIKRLSSARGSEVKEAILEGKQYLECLKLYWRPEKQESEEVVSVMESLQPHSNLKELLIRDYRAGEFPNWMMRDGLDLLLPNLGTIHIVGCHGRKVLPPFGQLPSLKDLHLSNLNAVERMEGYPSSAKPFFPKLKKLKLHCLPKLKGWGRRDVAEQAPSYPNLEGLHLENVNTELFLHLISVSSSLKSLLIKGIKNLISLPEELQHVSTLQSLTIESCSNLATLPDWIDRLRSRTELRIRDCRLLRHKICHPSTIYTTTKSTSKR